MMRAVQRVLAVSACYISWLSFGLLGLGLSFACVPGLLLPRRPEREARVRGAIRRLFALWVWWLRVAGILRITWRGFEAPLARGTVYIANHPTLLDATLLLTRLPDAVCIMKPKLMRNPAVGPAAIMGGYLSGEKGLDLVHDVAARIAAGQSLLIFPEGTRTATGAALGPLKPGFALIAARARAPVQLISIRASSDMVPRDRAWWLPPTALPVAMEFSLDRRWDYDPDLSVRELTAEVEQHLLSVLRAKP
jgi:1-acyl-sn-glycerol-3-phosphate acyltransferase